MLTQIVALFAALSSSSSESGLQQINRNSYLCDNDIVTFQCANFDDIYVNWDVRVIGTSPFPISFNSVDDPAGVRLDGHIGSKPLTAQVIYTNSSSIVSTISFAIAEHFNGANIVCNGDRIILQFNSVGPDILSTEIILTQINNDYDFILTWNSVPENVLRQFCLHVSPPPMNGVSPVITNAASAFVRFRYNSSYNLTLTGKFCTNVTVTNSFTADICPFLLVPNVQYYYHLWSNGSMTTVVRCPDHNITLHNCGSTGIWENSSKHLCTEEDKALTKEERSKATTIASATLSTTHDHDDLNIAHPTDGGCRRQNNRSVLIGVCCGLIIFFFLISLATFFLGLKCGINRRKILEAKKQMNKSDIEFPEAVLYEDVLDMKTSGGFTITNNTAYGEVLQT